MYILRKVHLFRGRAQHYDITISVERWRWQGPSLLYEGALQPYICTTENTDIVLRVMIYYQTVRSEVIVADDTVADVAIAVAATATATATATTTIAIRTATPISSEIH